MPIILTLRRSNKTHRSPTSLQDYVCHTPYHITHSFSYDNLSNPYKDYVLNVSLIYEPQYYHQAASIPEWCKGLSKEIAVIEANHTWTVQALPHRKKTIGYRWISNIQFNIDGSLEKHKARLAANGYTQQHDLDFIDTLCPIAKLTLLKVILSIVVAYTWKLAQLDINNAFLNGDLLEEIYMDLPLCYPSEVESIVCKLHK